MDGDAFKQSTAVPRQARLDLQKQHCHGSRLCSVFPPKTFTTESRTCTKEVPCSDNRRTVLQVQEARPPLYCKILQLTSYLERHGRHITRDCVFQMILVARSIHKRKSKHTDGAQKHENLIVF